MSTIPRKYCVVKLRGRTFISIIDVCDTIEQAQHIQDAYSINDCAHNYVICAVIPS